MLRRIAGVSQIELGRAIGVTFQQIQKYENGKNRIGSGRLQQIADVLKVSASVFFQDVPGGLVQNDPRGPSAKALVDFVSTGEGCRLARAFMRIGDKEIRWAVVDLVASIVDPAHAQPESGERVGQRAKP
jgi:transcriptional regulator with XRE-family HTH domain